MTRGPAPAASTLMASGASRQTPGDGDDQAGQQEQRVPLPAPAPAARPIAAGHSIQAAGGRQVCEAGREHDDAGQGRLVHCSGPFTDALGERFLLTSWLPSLLLIGAILTEVAVAAGVSRVTSWVQSFPGLIQAAGVALILLVVTLVAALLAVNSTSLLRFCEGYWGNGWLYRHIGLRRRAHYSQVIEALDTDAGYGRLCGQFPPPDLRDRAMPTRVGNILLSAELIPSSATVSMPCWSGPGCIRGRRTASGTGSRRRQASWSRWSA